MHSMLFICLSAAQYAQHTNKAYLIMVADPGDIPNYLGVQDAGHRTMLGHNFCCQKKWFNDEATMNLSLIDHF